MLNATDNADMPQQLLQLVLTDFLCIGTIMDSFHCWRNFLLWKNIFLYLKNMMFHLLMDQFCQYLNKRHHFIPSQLFSSNSPSEADSPGTSGSATCICMLNIIIHTQRSDSSTWTKCCVICKQLSLLIFHQTSYRLVSHLKFIYVILVLIVYFKFTVSHSSEKIKTHCSPTSYKSHGYTLYKLTNSMPQTNGP